MPRRRTTADLAAGLASLPRLANLTIAGDVRPTGTYFMIDDKMVQTRLAVWMDVATGLMRSYMLIVPRKIAEAEEAVRQQAFASLVNACASPEAPNEYSAHAMEPPVRGSSTRGKAAKPARPKRGLPSKVQVSDAELAAFVRGLLDPLEVAVEQVEADPRLDALFAEAAEEMGVEPDAAPPEPFSWQVDETLLPPLFKAAAGLWRRAPWNLIEDNPPIAVELGAQGFDPATPTLYASILGGLGAVFGVAFYFSVDDFHGAIEEGERLPPLPSELGDLSGGALEEMLRQAGAPIDMLPPELRDPEMLKSLVGLMAAGDPADLVRQNSLAMYFDTQDEADPTYLSWLRDRKLKGASRDSIPTFLRLSREGEPRQPNEGEARSLTLALDALNSFFSRYGRALDMLAVEEGPLTHTAQIERDGGTVPVTVTYPAPGFTLDTERFDPLSILDNGERVERPPSPEDTTVLYRFKVELKEGYAEVYQDIWRRIEVRGDQTLHDLHVGIQRAFNFGEDHLYSFFLSNKAWDSASEYSSPFRELDDGEEERDAMYRLAEIPLKPRKRFMYLFDYGDDWRFTVTTEAIIAGGVEAGVAYPRVIEQYGEAPDQYPMGDELS